MSRGWPAGPGRAVPVLSQWRRVTRVTVAIQTASLPVTCGPADRRHTAAGRGVQMQIRRPNNEAAAADTVAADRPESAALNES